MTITTANYFCLYVRVHFSIFLSISDSLYCFSWDNIVTLSRSVSPTMAKHEMCSQGLGPNDNVRADTQRLAGIPWLSLSRSHYTDTDPTSRDPDCARLRLEPATSGPRSETTTN
ncbi:hypothetical protein ElyMa_001484100 [Elysia marginata]|uniref:Uncharacterized protein n=1 Tax=Elysia marginata TaxID=1093978 RepID=A0AAV4J6F7_9GAST|nr:hypothetical protein ElyMa_001484100 [Elysia marginata]